MNTLTSGCSGRRAAAAERFECRTPCVLKLPYIVKVKEYFEPVFLGYVPIAFPGAAPLNIPVHDWRPQTETNISPKYHKLSVFQEGYKVSTHLVSYGDVQRAGHVSVSFNKVIFLEKEEKPFRLPVEVYTPSKK